MARRRRATITIEWTPSDGYPNAEYVLWGAIFPDLPVTVKVEAEEDLPASRLDPSV